MMGMSKKKFIIILVLVFGAFVIHYSYYVDNNIKARIWSNEEKDFLKPIDVVWRGEIISTMVSGSCMGLKGEFDKYRRAMACLSNTDSDDRAESEEVLRPEGRMYELWKFEGEVTITGKWLGITCAYKNTIFGECVPDIMIESIE